MSEGGIKSVCPEPGCGALTDGGRCEIHRKAQRAEQGRRRPSAAARGYGSEWRRIRAQHIAQYPWCQWPGCSRPAVDVDHVISKARGGTDDPGNLRSLCHSHHSIKTAQEDGAFGRDKEPPAVTLVCGAPGSGKTAYVKQRARRGDLIVDLDAIVAALTGLEWYDKPESVLPYAWEVRDALYAAIAQRRDVRAWVIAGLPKAAERYQLAQRIHATEVVVCETTPTECLRRISEDERRAGRWQLWEPLVQDWWRSYSHRAGEIRVIG